MQQSTTIGGLFAYAERPQVGLDVDIATDPASGAAFLQADGRRHEELKQMLDSNKDGLKLEAMKRIISMVARGRDVSELFAAVVKNVVSKNIEVKKLVYVYLVRYAEEQQDLALLSISTFQRALKDPNQLIRASALRVLSSIRVHMIVPIVMLAIQESSADLSPYVRKTAAHAIPKLYSLDPDQKDELVTVIDKLLSDRTTLVVGSAVMAFDEVCPERVDLIHKNYRKLCNLLVDVDEWGQVIIINMLTRYARTQFVDPNADDDDDTVVDGRVSRGQTNSNEDHACSDASEGGGTSIAKQEVLPPPDGGSSPKPNCAIDLDHRLLLRSTKPLLQSRNSCVVMAVVQLYHHLAPNKEVQLIAKPLVRFLRAPREIQSIVLACIASISTKRKSIFESHVKSFFVRTSDPTHIKLLKVDILTNLSSVTSVPIVLREFQTYIASLDRSFVAATIQAIGRIAASISEVTESCLSGLVRLLSNHDENVVAESIVVIKTLMQGKASGHKEIIAQMAKLIDCITVPAARAAIIWLIGEYNESVRRIAPDVLRKMAKSFPDEHIDVKLQVLNLGVKLYLTNPEQTSLLCQYVFSMARFDTNYDIRDRARFMRQFIFPADGRQTILSENARRIFLAPKPAPASVSEHRDNPFQLGTLSHYLNMRANDYRDLPPYATEQPDPKVRNVEGFMYEQNTSLAVTEQDKQAVRLNEPADTKSTLTTAPTEEDGLASASSESASSGESVDSESDSNSGSGSSVATDAATSSLDSSTASAQEQKAASKLAASVKTARLVDAGDNVESPKQVQDGTSNSESRASTGSKRSNSITDDDRSEIEPPVTVKSQTHVKSAKNNLDLLLDLDDIPPIGPVMTPSLGGFLTPGTCMVGMKTIAAPLHPEDFIELVGPSYIELKHKELLNKVSGHGLQLNYRFTRAPHLYSSKMTTIELQFVNCSNSEITDIQMGAERLIPAGLSVNEFAPISSLLPQQKTTAIIGIDFNDSSQSIAFQIESSAGKSRVTVKPAIGELVRSVRIANDYFKSQRMQLRGMNEHQSQLSQKMFGDLLLADACKRTICECVNIACVRDQRFEGCDFVLDFAGQTLSSKSLVLVTVQLKNDSLTVTANCEKLFVGSMLLNELRHILSELR